MRAPQGVSISTTQITRRDPQVVGVEDADISAPTLSLREFLSILARRAKTVLLTFVAVLIAVLLLSLLTPSTFRSQARLLLTEQDKGGLGGGDALSQIFNRGSGLEVENQIQLISSPLILNEVFKQTQIAPDDVSFSATRVTGTNAIDLIATSHSRADVEKFMATWPDVYRDNRRNDRLREVTAQLAFAGKDFDAQNRKLAQLETQYTRFKNSRGIVDVDSEADNALKAFTDSKSDLDKANSNISSLQAQIAALRAEVNGLPATITTPRTTTNPQIEELRVQLADLQSKRAELRNLYKDNADPMRFNARQISDMEARIARTPVTVTTTERAPNPEIAQRQSQIAGLGADLEAQRAAIQAIRNQIAAQQQGLARFSQIQREGAQLKRQLEATRDAVKTGATAVRDLGVRAKALEAAAAPVTILQPGGPGEKISPKLSRNLQIGIFLGLLLGCVAALVQDSLDQSVRDEEEARQLLGVPALGFFPLMTTGAGNQILDLKQPDRTLLETFRALRSNVQFALVGSGAKKLQVTSAVPAEGKSYIASNLAITMALDGKRVVLVDADLHRPTLHERLEVKRQPGLSNVLVGQAALADALQSTGMKGLRVLSAGALPPNPAELLNSPAMDEVLRALEGEADVVILDTPPLLATADAQLLSAKADGVLMVMRVGSAERSATLRALELLQRAHANLLGVVFNKVKAGKNSAYEYYGGYYSLPAPDEVLAGEAATGEGATGEGANGEAATGAHEPGRNGMPAIEPADGKSVKSGRNGVGG